MFGIGRGSDRKIDAHSVFYCKWIKGELADLYPLAFGALGEYALRSSEAPVTQSVAMSYSYGSTQ